MQKDIAKHIKMLMFVFLMISGTTLALSYIFKINLTIIAIVNIFVGILSYAYARNEMEEEDVDATFKMLVGVVFTGMYGLSYFVFYNSLYKEVIDMVSDNAYLQNMDKSMASAAILLSVVVNIAMTFFFIVYLKDEDRKEKFNLLKDISFNKGKNEEISKSDEPDVKLCVDKETGKDVIWKHKDRYTHMLCLGPTGCGKTSQTIIPLIHQDMQRENIGITILEPKSDLAEKVFAMAKYYNKPVLYFNPVLKSCPYFNPLFGREEDVIENITTTFKMLEGGSSSQFFQDQNENLLRNALKVLKRLEAAYPNKYNATLIELSRLLQNINDEGRAKVVEFSRLPGSEERLKENADIAAWFLNDYFNTGTGGRGGTKTYEHCSGIRTQVAKLISNKYLRRVLNPPLGMNDIDFEKHLAEGGVIALTTSQGDLRELGKTLGLFLILQFQSAVFRRPLPESSRMPHMFYIDEFQEFANPSFGIFLTQARSYRTGCHLATQARKQIAVGKDGNNFLSLVSANARNLVIYPGIDIEDAMYYSKVFGEETKESDSEVMTVKPFDPFKGSMNYSRDVTRRIEKKTSTRFSPTDIREKPFGEVTYAILENSTVQAPAVGKMSFIDKDINDKLDEMLEEYREANKIEDEDEIQNNEKMEKNMKKDIEFDEETMYYGKDERMSKKVNLSEDDAISVLDSIFEQEKELNEDVNIDIDDIKDSPTIIDEDIIIDIQDIGSDFNIDDILG